MSQQVDLKEFLSAYLAEVDEQLQAANARLLEIEAAAKRGEASPRAVRDLFRAMHTVKGLSAMVGVESVVGIAHRMEAVLRLVDGGGGRVELASVDVFLRAVRAIEHSVGQVAAGKTVANAPLPILDALDQLEPTLAPARGTGGALDLDPRIEAKLAPFERDLLTGAAATGRRAMRVDFSPSPAKAEKGLSINTVRERAASVSEIVKVVPISVPVTADAPGGLSFALLVLTSASDEELAGAVSVPVESLHSLAVATSTASPLQALREPDADDEPFDDAVRPQHRNIVRVDVTRLDDAMQHLSTLIVTRSRLARAIGELAAAGVNTRDLTDIMRDNARQLRDLRSSILRVRMIPMAEVLERIPLILRGLRRESGKQIRVSIDARDTELDKGVAERLFPAIVHLVRNAVDHAIEPAEERRAAGKPEEGSMRITCVAKSNTRLELTVSDDGRGVDRAAVERRLGHGIPGDDAALLEALCRSGLSTKEEATTTSGRGMGMDIVKRIVVDQLGGELTLTTSRGSGTTFTLRVPLTIAIVDAFTMDCHGQRFVVPVAMIEEILEIDRASVRYGPSSGNREDPPGLIQRRGETVPVLDLASLLLIRKNDTPARHALVVRRGGAPIAFALDKVIGQQEAVVRPLVDPLVHVTGVSGATDLGDGKPTLVLDLVALGGLRASREARQGPTRHDRPPKIRGTGRVHTARDVSGRGRRLRASERHRAPDGVVYGRYARPRGPCLRRRDRPDPRTRRPRRRPPGPLRIRELGARARQPGHRRAARRPGGRLARGQRARGREGLGFAAEAAAVAPRLSRDRVRQGRRPAGPPARDAGGFREGHRRGARGCRPSKGQGRDFVDVRTLGGGDPVRALRETAVLVESIHEAATRLVGVEAEQTAAGAQVRDAIEAIAAQVEETSAAVEELLDRSVASRTPRGACKVGSRRTLPPSRSCPRPSAPSEGRRDALDIRGRHGVDAGAARTLDQERRR